MKALAGGDEPGLCDGEGFGSTTVLDEGFDECGYVVVG